MSQVPDTTFQDACTQASNIAVRLAKPPYWVHTKTGRAYKVLGPALEEASLKVLVVYTRIALVSDPGWEPVWTRPAEEFFDRFEKGES